MLALPFEEVDQADVERELVRRNGLAEFIKLAWDIVPAGELVWSWHLGEIAKHLEAVSRGDLRRLVINVPPGMSKTRIVSILWPAWDWIARPSRRFMTATYSTNLSHASALANRSLVRSEWYSKRWPTVSLATGVDDQETIESFGNTAGGKRFSATVGGQITGFHADIQIVDDPTKPEDIKSGGEVAKGALERTWNWWTATMASRKTSSNFARVLIMQRLCEGDLVDRIMNGPTAKDWTLLCLPMEFEPERACVTPWGRDQRIKPGELLCPERFDAAAVAETKADMGTRVAAAQLQQRPAPAQGNIFQRAWFAERWTELPADLVMVQSWDTTVKGGSSSDFVAGHIWGYARGKFYLVDRIHDRMGFPETCRCIQSWAKKYPHAYGKLIENAATGPAIEQTLRDKVSGIILIKPQDIGGSKEARANAIAPFAEAGNIVLPDPSVHAWADEFLEELLVFPMGRHDDDVDACTQAVLHLHGRSHARYLDAMKAVREGRVDNVFRRSA